MQNLSAFPYVEGQPVTLGLRGGSVVLAACALSFVALLWLPYVLAGAAGQWASTVAFVVLQLAGLAVAVGPAWKAVFKRPRLRDLLVALACVPLVVGVPALVALFVLGSHDLASNPVLDGVVGMQPAALAHLLAMSAIQLLGEELVTILPMLVLLAALRRSGVSPWLAIGIAWIATALMFGALHLPTYQWHFGQALLVIGAARMVLTGVYLLTRNLWASTLAHVVNDWTLMAIAIGVSRTGIG